MARILLVDDDPDFRRMLQQTLVHFGHTVIEAANGRAGVALFRQAGADLVITDMVMPEQDGLEVLLALRREQPPVKFIAISGGGPVSAAEYLKIATILGATRVLTKPIVAAALRAAIDEALAANPG